MFQLCGGNKSLPLRFSLYSKQPGDRKPLLYGRAETTVKELETNNPDKERDLMNEKAKPRYAGVILFPEFTI